MKESLDQVRNLLNKDPLEPLSRIDREIILFSRDYICTIPSALELFLRSVDWLNPLQVNLAKLYIKKWEKIDPEDAISLLDARYPCTFVREYAVSILSEATDDILATYMLQMCQSLMYELYHVSPLADLLTEKCIKSPKVIGHNFFWNAQVCMKNILFEERLSVILTNILMLIGPYFIQRMTFSAMIDVKLKEIALEAKEKYNTGQKGNRKLETTKHVKSRIDHLNMKEFEMPIHPSYYCKSLNIDQCDIFDSKMVPIKVTCHSNDGEGSGFSVIYKCGTDY